MQDAFCHIPATTLPSGFVIPSFELGQYPCSRDDAGKVTVSALAKPIVGLEYFQAREACDRAGFQLLTMSQAIAIVYRASTWPSNYGCHRNDPWLQLTADSGASFQAYFSQLLFDDLLGRADGMAAGINSDAYLDVIGGKEGFECLLGVQMGERGHGHEWLPLFAYFNRCSFAGGRISFYLGSQQHGDWETGFRCTRKLSSA